MGKCQLASQLTNVPTKPKSDPAPLSGIEKYNAWQIERTPKPAKVQPKCK